jgi:hypothetical protein
MKCFWALVLFAAMAPSLHAVEKQYTSAKIIDVQQKTKTRVLYYQVDTPITQDEPFYEVSVQLGDMIYLGRYVLRHSSDTLPGEWQPGFSVQARVDSHHFFLEKSSGVDVEFAIAKRTAVKLEPKALEPTPAKK